MINKESEAHKAQREEKQRLKEAAKAYEEDPDLDVWGEIALGRELKKRKEERLEQIGQAASEMGEHP